MSDETPYARFIRALGEHLRLVVSASVALSLVLTGLWWLGGKQIKTTLRELVGTEEIIATQIEQGKRLQQNIEAINGLSERVAAMEPSPAVAEYDVLRSYIQDVCYVGEACEYGYVVRRTDAGESCGAPTAQRVLVDASSRTYFPQAREERFPQRLTGEWAVVPSAFIVPNRVVEGIAEFSLQITYPDCDPTYLGRAVVLEESPHLIFEIRRRE